MVADGIAGRYVGVCGAGIQGEAPVPITAKLDRGYRNAKGAIILIELKTRRVNRPYLSDVIELSAQRLAVQAQTGGTRRRLRLCGDPADRKQAQDGASG